MNNTRSLPVTGYTKAELARHCHLPESTIRYYCARFAPYLPAGGEGRNRRYAPSCLEVLAFIRENLPRVRTSRALDVALAERFSSFVPAADIAVPLRQGTIPARFSGCELPENLPLNREKPAGEAAGAALRLLERQSDALERIAAALDTLVEQGRRPGPEAPAIPPSDWESLREEVRALRLLVSSAEQTQQDDLDQLRQWLTRLAREQAHNLRSNAR